MNKMDISQWKEFNIADLFVTEKTGNERQVPTGAYIEKKHLKEGHTPRISVAGINNGICGYYEDVINNANYRVSVNFISVSFLGTVFYHPYKASLDMKVHSLKLKDKELNENIGGFLVTVIRKSIQNNDYSDQISSTVLPRLRIKLPIQKNGNPDFEYMEKYMRNLKIAVSSSLTSLRSAKDFANYNAINVVAWQDFHLYDLFEIDSGTKLDKAKMDTSAEEVDFVGRSNFNNGITQKVRRIEGLAPYPKGSLTLALGGAYLGSCFVQEQPFYTSQNVVVLIPKTEMSFLCKQFIATAIFKESQNNYRAFIKELNAHIKRDFTIKLPVKEKDELDYEFIENYMERIQDRVESFLSLIA